MLPDLTICTVSYKHKDIIETNIEFVKKMNPETRVRWIVVENSPEGDPQRMAIRESEDLVVVPGVPNRWQGVGAASYHHASGIAAALARAETRFVLVLDPDFYIVRKNWVRDMLSHMSRNNLAFFGVPYNPKRYAKYRYFPCVHCICIDFSQIDRRDADFAPAYASEKNSAVSRADTPVLKQKAASRLVGEVKKFLRFMLKRESVIGSSRDTGYRIFQQFHTGPAKSDVATPVFKVRDAGMVPGYLSSLFSRTVDYFLPDQLSYIPKKIGYYSEGGFARYGCPDLFALGWDEFLWEGAPFGFHMTGTLKGGVSKAHDCEMPRLREALQAFS